MAALTFEQWLATQPPFRGDENTSGQQQAQDAYDQYIGSILKTLPNSDPVKQNYFTSKGINDSVIQSSPTAQGRYSNLDQFMTAYDNGQTVDFGLAADDPMGDLVKYGIIAAGTAGMMGMIPGTTPVWGAGTAGGAGAADLGWAANLTDAAGGSLAVPGAAGSAYSGLAGAAGAGAAAAGASGIGAGAAGAAAQGAGMATTGAGFLGLTPKDWLGLGISSAGLLYGQANQPDLPNSPDYLGLANLQGQQNKDAALYSTMLANPNFTNPYGSQSVSYERDPATGNYIPRVSQQLNPMAQALFDQQMRTSQGMGALSEQSLGRVGAAMGSEFNPNLPGLTGGVTDRYGVRANIADAGGIQRNIGGTAGGVQYGIGNAGQIADSVANVGQAQRNLDFSGAPAIPGADNATRQRVEDALYSRATSRLDPDWQLREKQLETKLLNAGIERGTEAWNNAVSEFGRSRTDAYDRARESAIAAGGLEQSRLFDIGLQGRQQAVGETTAQGQFANSGQAQDFTQALARGTFGNTAQGQRYAQMLGAGAFNNQAQAQDFNQQAQRFTSANQAQQQQFNQNASAAQQYNSASDLDMRNQIAGANFGNQARYQALNEALTRRQLPLNEFNAFRSGSQVTLPNFQGYNSTGAQASPTLNAATQQYGANLDAYNANVGQRNSTMNGLFGIGSSFLAR